MTEETSRYLRWESRYRTAEGEPQPARVLRELGFLLPQQGQALDLACGYGGNALLMAAQGLAVTAWDYAGAAIEDLRERASVRGLPIRAEVRDVCAKPLPSETFDVIVVSFFLDRGLVPAIADALRPGGLLFYETFVREAVGTSGPTNPDFRLMPGELLRLFAELRVIDYREHALFGDTEQGQRDIATLVATRQA